MHGKIYLMVMLFFISLAVIPQNAVKVPMKMTLTPEGKANSDETEENNQVSRKASLFVLPLGATVNMNGTALYEAVAVMFIAQMMGIEMGFAEQMIVLITATLAGIGAAGIPEAGLVTMVMVLQAVGLPLEGIGMLLSIDWFLDRCRTTLNVWGDSVGAAVVDTLEEKWVEKGGKV